MQPLPWALPVFGQVPGDLWPQLCKAMGGGQQPPEACMANMRIPEAAGGELAIRSGDGWVGRASDLCWGRTDLCCDF